MIGVTVEEKMLQCNKTGLTPVVGVLRVSAHKETPMSTKTETKDAPKTEMPKFDNPFAGFDPMSAWTHGQQAMHQLVADAMQRMTSFADDYAALEAQMFTRAQGAVANWAQLTHDAIAYSAQLSMQARKLGLETARKFGTTGA
jgi:hypothetical protein